MKNGDIFIGKNKANLGFGLGISGTFYVLSKITSPQKISPFIKELEGNLIANIERYFETTEGNPIAHGFLNSPLGVLSLSDQLQESQHWNSYITLILKLYSELDLSTLNPSFYGGLSGMLYILSLKRDIFENLTTEHQQKYHAINDKIIDLLGKYQEKKDFNHIFKGIESYSPPVGFAWGSTGMGYSQVIYGKFFRNKESISRGRKIYLFEQDLYENIYDQLKSKLKSENKINEEIKNLTSLCYGLAGHFKLAQAIGVNISDKLVLFKKAGQILMKLAEGNIDLFNYCCGNGLDIENSIDTFGQKMETYNSIQNIFFINGIPGIIFKNLVNQGLIEDFIL